MDAVFLEKASLVMFWFAFALYVGATVLYAYQFLLRRQKVSWWARFLTGAGLLLHTLSIGAHSMANEGTPLNGSNQLVLAAWALVILYFVVEHVLRIRAYGAFLIPVAVAFMAAAQLISGGLDASFSLSAAQQAQLDDWRTGFHVLMIVFGSAGFMFGGVSAMLHLWQQRQLKRHKTNKVSRRLPSLATLQNVTRRSIALAFPVYTAALTLGIVIAVDTQQQSWWFDPRIMLAGIVLLTFALYLVLVYRQDVSSRTASWVAVVGVVLVIALAIVARTAEVGFHTFGVVG